MIECRMEEDVVTRNCEFVLDGWGLDASERAAVRACGVSREEVGGAVALEVRARHIVDVDRAIGRLVGRPSLVGLWLRLPQGSLDGITPLEAITGHVSGLRFVRNLLVREILERGFE